MQIFDNGETILLGSEDAPTAVQVMHDGVVVLCIAAVSVLASSAFNAALVHSCTTCTTSYTLVLGFAVVTFLVLTGAFLLVGLYGYGDVAAVVFDRPAGQVEVYYRGPMATKCVRLSIHEIRSLRLSRGEWDGESAKSMPVLQLVNGDTILVDEPLTSKDFALLKTLTGIRGA